MKMRITYSFCLVIGLILSACGGSESEVNCLTKSTEFQVCHGSVLYKCPVGTGDWQPMIKVRDCADDGMTCEDRAVEAYCSTGSLLGPNPTLYSEVNDLTNNSHDDSEQTGYTLDTEGIKISGSLQSSDSGDYFRFNTGTFGRIDVQLYVDGEKQGGDNYVALISLNAFVDDGYSTLSGRGYFINAEIQPSMSYVIGILNTSADSDYYLEMKGNE
ncbi:MAG: hypothetical protein JRJ87_23990 [Deltaproteobacteria bacterium]|nr:hypothetical protein [Deltaproteobacteria bacterium]